MLPEISEIFNKLHWGPKKQLVELSELKKKMISNALDTSEVDSFIEIIENGLKRVCGNQDAYEDDIEDLYDDRFFADCDYERELYRLKHTPEETDKDKYSEHC